MNSKSTNKFKLKDYIFLTICLIIFFTVILYIMGFENFPKGNELITTSIGVLIAIPFVLYVLKKLNDEKE